MRIFAHKQTENRQRTDNQVNKQRTLNSKTEATLILCGSSGERANSIWYLDIIAITAF